MFVFEKSSLLTRFASSHMLIIRLECGIQDDDGVCIFPFVHSNLEDKVLLEGERIVMNQADSIC